MTKDINFKKYPYEQKIRHHVSAHNYLPYKDLKNVPDTYPPLYKQLRWEKYYDNGQSPDVIDIGCGKGHFLLDMAFTYPDKNCLGIEVRSYLPEWVNGVCKGEGLKNCHALFYSVANGLEFINDDSIESVFYLFPDPWPKKRHFNRRAFNEEFVKEVYRILKPNCGKLWLATDCDYVDEYQREILDEFGKFNIRRIETNEWNFPNTNKERFCIRKNIEVFRCVCEK